MNPVLLVPWDASLGEPSGPAELPGFGLLDENDTLDLLRAARDNPASRWCITVHSEDGAAAPGCATGRALRHLIQARNIRCAAPGCGQHAAACDLDHNVPWKDAGATRECNLSPLGQR